MKGNCCAVRELLGAFADGELDPARAEEVRRHLETCAECRRELDQITELGRLAKNVEHPQLTEDYWDWHRTRVWHGIRRAPRGRLPAFRPTFAWARLATLAAGAVVVLLVVFAGWRALFLREGAARRVSETPAELRSSSGRHVAAAPSKAPAGTEAKVTGGGSTAEAETRSDGLVQTPEAERGAEKTVAGYVARNAGAKGGVVASEQTAPPSGVTIPRKTEVAADLRQERESLAFSAGSSHARVTAERQTHRIVSGPVLLEAPTIADADITDTGTVLLSVKTDSTGRVLNAAVRRGSGSKKLDSAALRQIRQSRFKAAVKNNRRVSSTFDYSVRFQQKQAAPQEQRELQRTPAERDGHKVQPQQNKPASDRSKSPDTGKKDTPLKEKTTK